MNWLTKTLLSQPVKIAAVNAAEMFIETVACTIATAIVEDMKIERREPGKKILRLIRNNNKENNDVQLHNQSEQT